MSDILGLDDIFLIVRNGSTICEVKSEHGLPFRIREQWATIGDDTRPWHIHINLEEIIVARFVKEVGSNGKFSYSIRFYDSKDNICLKAYFARMYDSNGTAINERLEIYESLFSKHGSKDVIALTAAS